MGRTIGQPKRTVIAINGSGGAFVNIPATCFARYVEITECPPTGGAFTGGNYAPQGINFTSPDDGFVAVDGLVAGDVLPLGSKDQPRDRAVGTPGWTDPAGAVIAPTIYAKMRSATVTGTQVEVREYP
jgi:hypothetical protein